MGKSQMPPLSPSYLGRDILDDLNQIAIHYDCLSNEQDATTIRTAIAEIERLRCRNDELEADRYDQ